MNEETEGKDTMVCRRKFTLRSFVWKRIDKIQESQVGVRQRLWRYLERGTAAENCEILNS